MATLKHIGFTLLLLGTVTANIHGAEALPQLPRLTLPADDQITLTPDEITHPATEGNLASIAHKINSANDTLILLENVIPELQQVLNCMHDPCSCFTWLKEHERALGPLGIVGGGLVVGLLFHHALLLSLLALPVGCCVNQPLRKDICSSMPGLWARIRAPFTRENAKWLVGLPCQIPFRRITELRLRHLNPRNLPWRAIGRHLNPRNIPFHAIWEWSTAHVSAVFTREHLDACLKHFNAYFETCSPTEKTALIGAIFDRVSTPLDGLLTNLQAKLDICRTAHAAATAALEQVQRHIQTEKARLAHDNEVQRTGTKDARDRAKGNMEVAGEQIRQQALADKKPHTEALTQAIANITRAYEQATDAAQRQIQANTEAIERLTRLEPILAEAQATLYRNAKRLPTLLRRYQTLRINFDKYFAALAKKHIDLATQTARERAHLD